MRTVLRCFHVGYLLYSLVESKDSNTQGHLRGIPQMLKTNGNEAKRQMNILFHINEAHDLSVEEQEEMEIYAHMEGYGEEGMPSIDDDDGWTFHFGDFHFLADENPSDSGSIWELFSFSQSEIHT